VKPELASITGSMGFSARLPILQGAGLFVPEGRYKLSAPGIQFTGPTGEVWLADITMPKPMEIKGGEPAELKLGAPIKMTASVSQNSVKAGSRLRVEHLILGAAGEQYTVRSAKKGRVAPYVKLLDEQNKVLVQGKMEYG